MSEKWLEEPSAKLMLSYIQDDIKQAASSTPLCAVMEAGGKVGVYAIRKSFDENL